MKPDHLPGANGLDPGELARQQLVIGRAAATQGLAAAIEPEDIGRPLEGAEHDGEPAVSLQMRGGLVAAAGSVEIDDGALVDDRERVGPARRNVDSRIRRRRRGEEHPLAVDEFAVLCFKLRKLFAHDGGS